MGFTCYHLTIGTVWRTHFLILLTSLVREMQLFTMVAFHYSFNFYIVSFILPLQIANRTLSRDSCGSWYRGVMGLSVALATHEWQFESQLLTSDQLLMHLGKAVEDDSSSPGPALLCKTSQRVWIRPGPALAGAAIV